MATIEFTNNYQDLSTDRGFQFKFFCETCGNGHMSTYKMNTLGTAGGLLEAAGSLFGGMFGRVGDAAFQVQRSVGGKAHDEALREAVEEIRPKFTQCRRCGQWACREVCFNPTANMCKKCAPIASQEEIALRGQAVGQQIQNDIMMEEEKRVEAKKAELGKKCGACGADTLGAKFCPECGKPTSAVNVNCGGCGAKLTPGAKFCGSCGKPVQSG